ncbi:putative clathrin assembly protein At4g40080 [Coffea eugenioides]|uniref:Clathrin assembly protein At4g40080 n=1 Tax=Coffea arabica TaxID=13443 RepID=A0A6P6TI69_COFAR|nr:putative clathrin assembly protein At4g40080 [Coffea arabica]XP_027179528.1 putative clathrin assembly protein At4g40080 [Coffea eugenioides]
MGRITTLRDLIGVIKDKASASKAAFVSTPETISLRLAVLRVTAHMPSTPPNDNHISALLALGDSSRTTASALISSLMDRLHRTSNSTVALKCLLTLHHIIKRGPFILQDQLSIFPAAGGYNYLKLSSFRDGATAFTWVLSAWVRWYARYIESLLSTSRVLGYFLGSTSCSMERDKQEERISSFLSQDLVRDIDSLVGMIEEICKGPDPSFVEGNKLLYEVINLLSNDYLSAVNEILSRLSEFNLRLSGLSFAESVELVCALKRLEDCKEKLSLLFPVKKPSTENLWVLVSELREKTDKLKVYKEEKKLLTWGKCDKGSESARFVMKRDDSVQFSSGRLGGNKLALFVVESGEATTL